jgi:hypothetical protein
MSGNNMKSSRTALFIVILMSLLSACGLGDSPEKAAREWLKAYLSLDGNKLLERTCIDRQADVQEAGTWLSAYGMLGEMLTGQKTKADISDLHFDLISETGNSASVHVYGVMSVAVLASFESQNVDEEWQMVKEDGKWKWCSYAMEDVSPDSFYSEPDNGEHQPNTMETVWQFYVKDVKNSIPIDGWKTTSISIVVENISGQMAWFPSKPNGILLDTGEFEREVKIDLFSSGRKSQNKEVPIPPGFRVILQCTVEVPELYDASKLQIFFEDNPRERDTLEILATTPDINLPFEETPTIVQDYGYVFEFPKDRKITVLGAEIVSESIDYATILVSFQVENIGGYDINPTGNDVAISGIDDMGYYSGPSNYSTQLDIDQGVWAMSSKLAPGQKGVGTLLMPAGKPIDDIGTYWLMISVWGSDKNNGQIALFKVTKTEQTQNVEPTETSEVSSSLVTDSPRTLLPEPNQMPKAINIYESYSTSNQEAAENKDDPNTYFQMIENMGRIVGEYDLYLHDDWCDTATIQLIYAGAVQYDSTDGAKQYMDWIQSDSADVSYSYESLDGSDLGDIAVRGWWDDSEYCSFTVRMFEILFQRYNIVGNVYMGVNKDLISDDFSMDYIFSLTYDMAQIIDNNILLEVTK